MSNVVEVAKELARVEHKNDRYGNKDYFAYHLSNVAKRAIDYVNENNISIDKESIEIVAYLHDIHEDHDYPIKDIEKMFGNVIAEAVKSISYDKDNESREEYYRRVYKNDIGRIVKIADASENGYNCYLDGNVERKKYYDSIVEFMGS